MFRFWLSLRMCFWQELRQPVQSHKPPLGIINQATSAAVCVAVMR